MAALSELLNEPPVSTLPLLEDSATDNNNSLPTQTFAPELFEVPADNIMEPTPIKTEENGDSLRPDSDGNDNGDGDVPETIDPSTIDAKPTMATSASPVAMKAPAKPRKSDVSKKDSKHSSKNEGQHTDRRYMCYVCQKLFTRRRSVRDHISKIHNTKTWEPLRSLEIIVEPETGEPLGSLEEQIANGGAPPLERVQTRETQDENEEQEEELGKTMTQPALKTESSVESPIVPVDPTPLPPAPIIGRKRPLPVSKKGTARVKTLTPNKRPKISESEASTPFRSPSVASIQRGPTSRLGRATQSPASSRGVSVESSASPTSSAATPGSTNDDGEVFCICRKGDNHTWMIACDGACEEWYHGNCVSIRERDGDLIDKYICPRCRRDGYQTTWKRMCRRKGCRKPAKVFEDPPSKYCSRDCGRIFFVDLIAKGDLHANITKNGQYITEMERPPKRKKTRQHEEKKKSSRKDTTPMVDGSRPHTPAYSDDEEDVYETDSSMDDDMLPNRGGALRAGEVKALLERCKTVDVWRDLGRKPATPPREIDAAEVEFDDFETTRLAKIEKEMAQSQEREDDLLARETLLNLVKARSSTITDLVKKSNPKQKDLCGYDPRLTWSEDEFVQWLRSGGKKILDSGQIDAPEGAANEAPLTNGHVNGSHGGDEDDDDDDGRQSLPTKDGVCVKNRCQRHGSNRWQKAQLAELRFEQDLVQKSLERLRQQSKEIRERAVVRTWERRGGTVRLLDDMLRC